MAWFFGLHNYSKPGKGVRKDEPQKTGVSLYFDILFRRFWKIVTMNLIYIVCSIPAILISFFISNFFVTWIAEIAGVDAGGEFATSLGLLGIFMTVVLLQVCGSGPASAGMSYVLRKYVNDTHSWVWSDFKDNMKSNFRQSMAVYVINLVTVCILLVGFVFYTHVMKGSVAPFCRAIIIVLAAIFAIMQSYTYQLMVGFELSVKNIYKNAAIFVIAKLPWNIFTMAISALFMYVVYTVAMSYPPIAFVIVLTLFYSMITFTQIFMTNGIVKKYLLEPSLKALETEDAEEKEETEEADFEDVG